MTNSKDLRFIRTIDDTVTWFNECECFHYIDSRIKNRVRRWFDDKKYFMAYKMHTLDHVIGEVEEAYSLPLDTNMLNRTFSFHLYNERDITFIRFVKSGYCINHGINEVYYDDGIVFLSHDDSNCRFLENEYLPALLFALKYIQRTMKYI